VNLASADLLEPQRLWSRAEILAQPNSVPRAPGIYAWYFREIPPGVPHHDCIAYKGLTLLYIGIAPTRPPANGKAASTRTLANRLREHLRGLAEGSTLRLSLGCLLSARLGLELRRVGSGRRMTFGAGERALSEWMARNALVAWTVYDRPWELEEQLIHTVSLPLNLEQNRHHAFHDALSASRAAAKAHARALPVLSA
jgi:hypothetical protein